MIKYFIIWLASIAIFVLTIFFNRNNTNWSDYIATFFWINIIVGFFSFIFFIANLEKYLKQKYSSRKTGILATGSAFILIALGLSVIALSLFLLFKNDIKINKLPINTKVANFNLLNPGITVGTTSDDVKIIQSALKTDPSLYSSGIVTGYYGSLTKEAVINFQRKYSLTETGAMDSQTTQKFNEVYGNQPRSYYLNLAPTDIPIQNNSLPINDSDSITTCTFQNIGSMQLRKSVCASSTDCEIEPGHWYYYSSIDQCKKDQTAYWAKQNQNNTSNKNYIYPTYAPLPSTASATYYSCTLYYPSLHYSQTLNHLYKTKDECDSAQTEINKTSVSPTSYVYTPPTVLPDQCRSNVISQYAPLLQNCNNQFGGGNSAYDACIQITSGQRDSALSQCGN